MHIGLLSAIFENNTEKIRFHRGVRYGSRHSLVAIVFGLYSINSKPGEREEQDSKLGLPASLTCALLTEQGVPQVEEACVEALL